MERQIGAGIKWVLHDLALFSLSLSLALLCSSSSLIQARRTLCSHHARPISSIQPSERDHDCDSLVCERVECACPRCIDAVGFCNAIRCNAVCDASTVTRPRMNEDCV